MIGFGVKLLVCFLVTLLVCIDPCLCKQYNCSIEITAGKVNSACNDDFLNGILKKETLDLTYIHDTISHLSDSKFNDTIDIKLSYHGKLFDILHAFNTTTSSIDGGNGKGIICFIIVVSILVGLALCLFRCHFMKGASVNISKRTETPPPAYSSDIPLTSFN